MGRRSRRRQASPALDAPEEAYASDSGHELTLRCVLTAKTRAEYARLSDPSQARAAATADDVWHRRVEFLFERLAVRWTVHGVPTEGARALLARFRAATPDEREWVRDVVRRHCREWFPDVAAP